MPGCLEPAAARGPAAERFGVDAREVLVGLGRRGAVTGQEDLAIELAGELAGTREGRLRCPNPRCR